MQWQDKVAMPGDSRRALEQANWHEIARRLTLFAKRRLGTRGTIEDAQDLAFEAIRRTLDPDYASWDGSRPLLEFLGSIVNGLIQNRTRSRPLKLEVARPLERLDAAVPGPEQPLAARQVGDRALALLSARLDGDDVGVRVLGLSIEGIDKPQDQAQQLGVPVKDIYNARRRLAAHVEAVRAQLSDEDNDVEEE